MTRPAAALILLMSVAASARALDPIPDKLVVLTFDDSSKSHYTVARTLLLKHKFGATFFVTEGCDFATNKKDYMSWEEIAQLHKDGFEIGNHTIDHLAVTDKSVRDLSAQVKAINARCKEHGIPQPVSFAYPGNAITKDALPILKDLGIKFARRGGAPEYPYKEGRGFAYEPGLDHPLLLPTAGDARPAWTLDDLKMAVAQARHGKIAVLQRESAKVRDRYGRHPLGQYLLMARRLVESGVGFVSVNGWCGFAPGEGSQGGAASFTWDMHGGGMGQGNIFGTGSYGLGWALPRLDEALSALLEDLHDRGLLKNTLVVVVGEFGRTPKIETNKGISGRSHWPACFSAVLAGAGIGGGVYGESDKIGAYVKDRPVPPQVLGATLYHALGVPLDSKVGARPITTGEPIHELFS